MNFIGGGPEYSLLQGGVFHPRRLLVFALALAVIAATIIVTPGSTSASDSTAVRAIDNNDRRQVAATYRAAIEDKVLPPPCSDRT